MSTSTTVPTVLGQSVRVVGDLHLDHDAVVAGEITGNVHTTAHLELLTGAVVQGDLHAASLTLAGRVKGNVYVKDTTDLQRGAAIQGQLDTGHLVAAPGVSYEGTLRLHRPTAAPGSTPGNTLKNTPGSASESETVSPSDTPKLTLNRSGSRPRAVSDHVTPNPAPDAAAFHAVPGTVNAGLRPRRRTLGSNRG